MSKILVKGVYEVTPTDVVNRNDVDLHLSPKGYVIVVNSDGTPVGGTTSYVEDTASAGGESMIISGVVRQDTLASSTTTDGDYAYMKVDSTGKLYVNSQGGVASGAADSGNPVKVGGKYNSTLPTLVDGQRGDLQLNSRGALVVSPQNVSALAGSDGYSNNINVLGDSTANPIFQYTRPSVFNGTTWDRQRGDTNGTYIVGNVASGATDASNPVKVGGKYNTSAPTLTNGQRGDAQLDVNANLKTTAATLAAGEDLTNNILGVVHKPIAASTYSPSLYTALTQVTKANIKATPGNVMSAIISNTNAAVRYFQLHNKASAPTAGEVPIYSFPVPAGLATIPGVLVLGVDFFTEAGYYFSTGIGWAISTTYGTFTDSATNTEHIPIIHYI